MKPLLIVAGLVVALYGAHRLALFAESKGWIFYTIRPPRVRMLGLLEELVDPRVEYLVEEESSEAIRANQDESAEGSNNDDAVDSTANRAVVAGYRGRDGAE